MALGVRSYLTPMTVGEWIKRLRLDRGWSQDVLAAESRVPVRLIGGYERGEFEPSMSTLGKIAGALGVDLPWAMGRYPKALGFFPAAAGM